MSKNRIVEKTWKTLGFRVKPLRRTVILRTEAIIKKVGLIWLPQRLQSFYGELPHMQLVTGIVLAAGPQTELKPGDRIAFTRLYFARLWDIDADIKVGYVDSTQVAGYASDDDSPPQA